MMMMMMIMEEFGIRPMLARGRYDRMRYAVFMG